MPRSLMLVVGVLALVIAACSGTAPGATGTPPATHGTVPTNPGTALPGATPSLSQTAAPAEPAASLPVGNIDFRAVNMHRDDAGSPEAVDVYVRTQGLVEAALVVSGLEFGQATDHFAPPDPGTVVVMPAGAGDPTCVGDCPHFISSTSTGFGEGDRRTLVLYDEGTLELWHDPDPDSVGTTGNALAPADPSTALLYVVAVGLQDADFGLRLGYDGVAGCQANRTSGSILIGGNQVAVFAFDDSADVLLYDNRDTDCTEDPVGGPFRVSGPAGSRALLMLYGSPTDMEALTLAI